MSSVVGHPVVSMFVCYFVTLDLAVCSFVRGGPVEAVAVVAPPVRLHQHRDVRRRVLLARPRLVKWLVDTFHKLNFLFAFFL